MPGIPCSHAISCIWQKHDEPVNYVSDWYKKDCQIKIYENMIQPINPIKQWPRTGLNPMSMPPERTKPGRPKKLRRVTHDEVVPRTGTRLTRQYVTTKCSRCGKHGHNKTTCFRREQEQEVFVLNNFNFLGLLY